MADVENKAVPEDIRLLKSTTISVYVDEALPDILVVSYVFGLKLFKGVLLDSTKRNLPHGVDALNPALTPKPNPEEDVLYSVNQRFTYTDPRATKKRNVQLPARYKKDGRMTVRLRPRQVLCTKCKGICNENSESVSRKRKAPAESLQQVPPVKRGANAPITRSVYSEMKEKNMILVPKLERLMPEEISNALSGKVSVGEVKGGDVDLDAVKGKSGVKRILRKKRSVGSMEDLWDESVFEENANGKNNNLNLQTDANVEPVCISARTIKISYGPQGEGTVLKIPAKIENLTAEQPKIETQDDDASKAARRALKKAKKEARRRVLASYLGGNSPRYTLGLSSPRYSMCGSPRHQGNSPRYVMEAQSPRRRKHKVKHKKKHREDREKRQQHKEAEVTSTQQEATTTITAINEQQTISQKLSINLKRLNNIYTPVTAEENHSSSDELGEHVPDFPPSNPPLMLRINSQTLTSVPSADGGRLTVGDVVWGKIQGFPWWPGKVLTITNVENQGPQAQVSWYGSSTSSLMQCDQLSPYLENFKVRYNKKKRGAYKEAIKQATTEARENENRLREAIVDASPAHSIISNAFSSPREIDVAS